MDRKVSAALLALLLLFTSAAAHVLIIPDHVREIGPQAFAGCTDVDVVYLPDGCTVAADAFPPGVLLIRRADTYSFVPQTSRRALDDAALLALAGGPLTEMRAAVYTVPDASALPQLLFPLAAAPAPVQHADGSLTFCFTDPETLLGTRPAPAISRADREGVAAWLLSDDTISGVLYAFDRADGQLRFLEAVLITTSAGGFVAPNRIGNAPTMQRCVNNLAADYGPSVEPLFVYVRGGSGFTLRYDPASGAVIPSAGEVLLPV